MINKRILITTILLVAMAAEFSACATAESATTVYNANDVPMSVSVNDIEKNFIIHPLSVSSSIIQGQTNWHTKIVSGYYTWVEVNLDWGNTGNSLRLTIGAPDSSGYGPYYDSDDGSVDGKIHKYINCPGGVPQGTWYYTVYGYSVNGIEDYTV